MGDKIIWMTLIISWMLNIFYVIGMGFMMISAMVNTIYLIFK